MGRSTGLIVVAGLVLLAAHQAVAGPVERHVHIVGNAFSPFEILVQPGDPVVWDNHDQVLHTVTHTACVLGEPSCTFSSEVLDDDESFAFTFGVPGTFTYTCTVHGFGGLLVVDDPLLAPDLVISDLTITDVPASLLAPLPKKEVVATLANVGGEPAFTSAVTITYAVGDEERVLKEQATNALLPGQTLPIITRWTTTGHVGDFVVAGRADVGGVIEESAEDNNERLAIASVLTPPGVLPGVDLLDPL